MSELVNALMDRLRPLPWNALLSPTRGPRSAVLVGMSGRAYQFQSIRRDAASVTVWGGVYAYSRTVASGSVLEVVRDSTGAGLFVGYIGRTNDISRRDAEHTRLSDIDYSYDVILVLAEGNEVAREQIERDLIKQYNPPLNDQLRSYRSPY